IPSSGWRRGRRSPRPPRSPLESVTQRRSAATSPEGINAQMQYFEPSMPSKRPHYILGIHQSGSLSSAALVKDGILLAGAPEERFTRRKLDRAFPHQAVRFCLDRAGIAMQDITAFAVGWNAGENAALRYRGGFSDWMRYPGEWLSSVPNHLLPR